MLTFPCYPYPEISRVHDFLLSWSELCPCFPVIFTPKLAVFMFFCYPEVRCVCFPDSLTPKWDVFMFLCYPYPETSCVHVSVLSLPWSVFVFPLSLPWSELCSCFSVILPWSELCSCFLLSLPLNDLCSCFLVIPYPEVSCVHVSLLSLPWSELCSSLLSLPWTELCSSVFVVLVLKLAVFMWHVFLLDKSVVCLFLCSLHPQQDAHCVTFFFTLSHSPLGQCQGPLQGRMRQRCHSNPGPEIMGRLMFPGIWSWGKQPSEVHLHVSYSCALGNGAQFVWRSTLSLCTTEHPRRQISWGKWAWLINRNGFWGS